MTTNAAAAFYYHQHQQRWAGKGYAVFNPEDKDIDSLPVIYGFSNNNSLPIMHGLILAEDGTRMGDHGCSNEGYMLSDLGVLEGSRPDLHEKFKLHYPEGYRMEFVSYGDVPGHEGLQAAIKKFHEAVNAEE